MLTNRKIVWIQFVLLILPNRKGSIKVWVIHNQKTGVWWKLMVSWGNTMPTALGWFCFETSHAGTTIATALVAEGRCLSFTKTASCPTVYVISWATKGPATWCLQLQREADNSHSKNSSTVHPAQITGHFPSFQQQRAWGSNTDCQLPTQASRQLYSAYTDSPTLCTVACQVSSLLLVAWLLSEVSCKGSSPSGTESQWKPKSNSQAHCPRLGPACVPQGDLLHRVALQQPSSSSPCVVFAATEKSTQKETLLMRCLGILGKCSALMGSHFLLKNCLLLREETWEWGKEVTKICPSSHFRGETNQHTCQVIKTWWGNRKPQPMLIASTAATLSHHSFRTYVQQQHEDSASQLYFEHRVEEVRNSVWERPMWEILQKFWELPLSSQCHHHHLYHMQTFLSSRTIINTCGSSGYLCLTFAKRR